jgi:hypothetical protein
MTLRERCESFLEYIQKQVELNRYQRIIVFTHGGFIRYTIASIIGIEIDYSVQEPETIVLTQMLLMKY